MTPRTKGISSINPGRVILNSLKLYLTHIKLLTAIPFLGFLMFILDMVFQMYFFHAYISYFPFLIYLASIYLLISTIALIIAVSHLQSGTNIRFRTCFKRIRGAFWSFLFYSALILVLSAIGLGPGIVPGIWILIVFSMVPIGVTLERGINVSPLRLSRTLTRGHFFEVLVILMLTVSLPVGAIYLPLQLPYVWEINRFISLALLTFLFPFCVTTQVVLFHNLREEKEGEAFRQEIGGSRLTGWTAFLSLAGLVGLSLALTAMSIWVFRECIRTPFGQQLYYPYLEKRNERMIFPDGIQFEAPTGWLVRREKGKGGFLIYSTKNQFIGSARISRRSNKYIMRNQKGSEITPEAKANFYWNYLTSGGKVVNIFKRYPLQKRMIGGRTWHQFPIEYKETTRWESIFTTVGDQTYQLSYAHRLEDIDEDLLIQEKNNLETILSSLRETQFKTVKQNGRAMDPTLLDGDRMIAVPFDQIPPKRGDLVCVFRPQWKPSRFVLRIIGLPGETVEIKWGDIYVNGEKVDSPGIPGYRFYSQESMRKFGKPFRVPKGYYFLLQDNWLYTIDASFFGPIRQEEIFGKITEIYWPYDRRNLFH